MMEGFKKIIAIDFDHKKIWHNIVFFTVVLFCIAICFSAVAKVAEPIEYPLDAVYGKDWWIQQFDAFEKGQLNIDIAPSPELEKLENPYDPNQREGIGYLWDRAYYDGNYYSYFGIAPILTHYYPYYFITGSLPSVSFVCLASAVMAMLFLGLAYRELVIRFCRGANLWLTSLLFVGVAFSAGIFIGLCWSDAYYVAVLSAIEWSMIFLFLGFRAMRAKYTATRAVLLALSAVALTMTVWSRPTVALICLVILPVFIEYAVNGGKETRKDRVISISSFVLPLSLGAAAVMWYNAARFGSPFDFGSAYQLTVSDISQNKLDLSRLGDSLYYFFFQSPTPLKKFPFVTVSYLPPSYDSYFFYAKTVGAFAFGIPFAAIFSPFICKIKKDPVKFLTAIFGVALAVGVAFFDYCYAGVNLRYLIDFLPILSLIGAIVLLNVHSEAHGQESVRLKGLIAAGIFILCIVSVFMTVGVTRMNPGSHIFPL